MISLPRPDSHEPHTLYLRFRRKGLPHRRNAVDPRKGRIFLAFVLGVAENELPRMFALISLPGMTFYSSAPEFGAYFKGPSRA